MAKSNTEKLMKESFKDLGCFALVFLVLIIIPIMFIKWLFILFLWFIKIIFGIFYYLIYNLFGGKKFDWSSFGFSFGSKKVKVPKAVDTYKTKNISLTKTIVKTPYDDLFEEQIRTRGVTYFRDKRIEDYKVDGQIVSAIVNGSEKYNTSIEFYKNGKIKKALCSCPYHEENELNCKHIYALLIKYCDDVNIEGFKVETVREASQNNIDNSSNNFKEIVDICKLMNEVIEKTDELYNSINEYDDELDDLYEDIMEYKNVMEHYEKVKIKDLTDNVIEKASDDLEELEDLFDEFEDAIEDIDYDIDDEEEEFVNSPGLVSGFMAAALHNESKKKKAEKENNKEREELRQVWGLMDDEIDLVQKGEYNPWDFEEENLVEDDYYYEDDK